MSTKAKNPYANSRRKAAKSNASNLSEPAMLQRAEAIGELREPELTAVNLYTTRHFTSLVVASIILAV
jgi:hypothetical protein